MAEGSLDATGIFQADTVLAKHDETYMPKDVADRLKEQGVWREGKGNDHRARPFRADTGAGVALLQCTVPLYGAQRGNRALAAMAVPAALTGLVLIAIAFAALTHAYVISDFSVRNVAENSHSAKPLLYKLSGVWGNHEGSMLLWVLILNLFGGAVALFGRNLPLEFKSRVLAVQGSIALPSCSSSSRPPIPFAPYPAPSKAMASIPSFRTRRSPSIRPFSMRAMSGSRSHSPLRSPP